MKSIYSKLIIVLMILVVAFTINFNYHDESAIPTPQPQMVKKVIVVKKVYIPVPVKDSVKSDTNKIITLPKQSPVSNYKKYYRSRNFHRSGYIS